jgi:hypothetical protein
VIPCQETACIFKNVTLKQSANLTWSLEHSENITHANAKDPGREMASNALTLKVHQAPKPYHLEMCL